MKMNVKAVGHGDVNFIMWRSAGICGWLPNTAVTLGP